VNPPRNALQVDEIVRRALGVQRGQTIHEVAARIERAELMSPARPVAMTVLRGDLAPWERMQRAARVAIESGLAS